MPHYDYLCHACGHEFELFQSMSAERERKCPACGELRLERLIGTGGGIVFRGSGFYETDYRSGSGGSSPKGGEDAGSGSDSKASSDSGSATSSAASSDDSGSGN